MLNQITYKTNPEEIITLESVAILFDSISKRNITEIISLSLYPEYNRIRTNILKAAEIQRNKELLKLSNEIKNRKQKIKAIVWETLGKIGTEINVLKQNPDKEEELEQIIYEAGQIVNVHEKNLQLLEKKEKKISTGKYSRLSDIQTIEKGKPLRRQLENIIKKLSEISLKHDDCLEKSINEVNLLLKKTSYYNKKETNNLSVKNIDTLKVLNDKIDIQEICMSVKDNDLTFELFSNGNYKEEGTINGIIMFSEEIEKYS